MNVWEDYKKVLENLEKAFSKLMDKDGWWLDDYSLWMTEYEAWSIEDMLYLIRNAEELMSAYNANTTTKRLEMLREDVEEWIQYNIDVYDLGISYINLRSWLMGCPRMPHEERDKLRKMKEDLFRSVHKYQEQYGKRDDKPQPKHLRNIKHK